MSNKKFLQKNASPPEIGFKELLWQFWKDIYGKEVQSAATYSYLWMADQAGHIALGILLQYIFHGLGILFHSIPFITKITGGNVPEWLGFALASIAVALWETSAYFSSAKESTNRFPLNKKGLRANAVVATLYMIIGAGIGYAIKTSNWLGVVIFLLCIVLAIILAPPWLKQKIIWQKASIPYLFRLANFRPYISQKDADSMEEWIQSDIKPNEPSVFVVAGRKRSGRTPLAAGVATELAFHNKKVRFLSFNELSEMASDNENFRGPNNILYWPWRESQILVIDDVGYVFKGPLKTKESDDISDFVKITKQMKKTAGKHFEDKHALWVLEDISNISPWLQAIADLHGLKESPRLIRVKRHD